MLLIKLIHGLQEITIKLIACEGRHRDSGFSNSLTLSLDIAALIRIKTLQIIFKGLIFAPAPQTLLIQPSCATCRLSERAPRRINIQKITT
jgi:hypothetical protein